jgi:hypothetical protein
LVMGFGAFDFAFSGAVRIEVTSPIMVVIMMAECVVVALGVLFFIVWLLAVRLRKLLEGRRTEAYQAELAERERQHQVMADWDHEMRILKAARIMVEEAEEYLEHQFNPES